MTRIHGKCPWPECPHGAECVHAAPPVGRGETVLPPLPDPEFWLRWAEGRGGYQFKVNRPAIGDTDCYTAEQMRAYARAALSAHPAPAMTDDELDEMALDELNLQDFGERWFVEGGFLLKQDLRILLCRAIETET